MTTQSPANTLLSDALTDDHQHIDTLLDNVCACADAGTFDTLDATWQLLEQELLAHLDREEMWMLPLFDTHAPTEAATIRADHARIRSELGELGVLIELHAVRRQHIESFAARLREHAARERRGIYRWADAEIPAASRPSLLRRLGHALRPWQARPDALHAAR